MRRILGVDPGTWKTGVGLVDITGSHYRLVHAEVVSVTQKIPLAQRLLIIFRSLNQIIRQYRPEVLALENIFYHKNLRAMIKIGEARAAAMLSASEQGIPVVEYLPTEIKQAVTGNGRASKEQIQHMVKRLLRLKEGVAFDASDALAVAICHAHGNGQWEKKAGARPPRRSRQATDKQWLAIKERQLLSSLRDSVQIGSKQSQHGIASVASLPRNDEKKAH